jgi:hypothetical protein
MFAAFFTNPVLKTILSGVGGAALVGLDSALQSVSGGMLAALNNQPTYAAAFTIGALLIHNMASKATFEKKPVIAGSAQSQF